MSQPVPGWYPDPAGSQRLRWWNGGQWIDQYQPMPGVTVQGAPAQHGTPTPNNQQGAPQQRQQGMPGPQGQPQQRQQEQAATRDTSAKKTRHMPSAKPAPTVSSDPYNATGTKPTFDSSDDASSDKTDKEKQKSSSGKGWLIGTAAAWIAVIALAVTSIYVGTMFKSARADLAQAESEHSTAQSELDQANSDLQQANKDLEEAQK